MNNSASASRRTWNRVMNALVWASAVLVILLVAGILGMVLVRGIPHISWKFLTTAIAKEMSYASGLQKQALFSIALVLFVFIMGINILLNVVLKGGKRDE